MPSFSWHEGNVLQDIISAGLHQNNANVHVFQHMASSRSSLPPGTAENRALPNTLAGITAHGRAVSNSPDHQGKAPAGLAALRTSGDAQPVAQSAEELQCLMHSSRFTKLRVKQLCLLYRHCHYRL